MLTRKKETRGTSASRSLDSSPSEKSVPNYLKPTLSSSSGDATDSALRLARRRSFDKPPSPTRTLKTPTTIRSSSFSSPSRTLKTRGVSPTPTFRSSSFSAKTTISPKGARARDAAGKQPSLYARSVSNANKSSTFLGNKPPKLDNAESPIAEAHQQILMVVAEQEMDEDTITQQLEAEIHKVDSPTFLEEDDDDDTVKDESPTILEETDHRHSCNVVDESPKPSEHTSTNPDHDTVAVAGDHPNEEVEEKESTTEEAVQDENAAPKEAHGKKDMALSNNVIEERVTMLREQRGNKVKALAGAFETVISLQDK